MSDDTQQQAEQPAADPPAEAPQSPFLTIRLTQDGLNVETNIRNPLMAYGVLEAAKDTLRENFTKKSEPLIARPSLALPPGLRFR